MEIWFAVLVVSPLLLQAQSNCAAVRVSPSSDYTFLSAQTPVAGGADTWLVNGLTVSSAPAPDLFLLHADNTLVSPATIVRGVNFASGKYGAAFWLSNSGLLAYPVKGSLDLAEGSLEIWVALRYDSTDPVYAARNHVLFDYQAPNGDYIQIVQASGAQIVYAGGSVGGQWQSAYSPLAGIQGWRAGEFHHLAYTWSALAGRMKLYIDGALAADTNDRQYKAPNSGGSRFALGGSLNSAPAAYLLDEVRISSRALSAAEVLFDARRTQPYAQHEAVFPLSGLQAGDQIRYTWTTPDGVRCDAVAFDYAGLPVVDVSPESTLLAPGTDSLTLTVHTVAPTSCTYALGPAPEVAFDSGAGTTEHRTAIGGLTIDPAVVNRVNLRCALLPDYVRELKYRVVARQNAPFPRKGNLWGTSALMQQGIEHAARVDLHLGAEFSNTQIRRLRELNPNVLVLTSINAVENDNLPDDYYLKDVSGKRIEVWPGSYRLNLTKPYVAEYQARYAYQKILDSDLLLDGCFFDNFMTTQSWVKADIYGNPVQIDADEDGTPDDATALDAAWRNGVYSELRIWRTLMPNAYTSGHLSRPPEPDTLPLFNGDSIGFLAPAVQDGTAPFSSLWNVYNGWFNQGRQPTLMMIESAPPSQISYGYGYDPIHAMPASTLEFARTYYPYVRFGLGLTLMNDGYFAHELGDTYHGNDWWYDELDFSLGVPLAPAQYISAGTAPPQDLMQTNGWQIWADPGSAAQSSFRRDNTSSAWLIDTPTAGDSADWQINFFQPNRALAGGTSYQLTFRARADTVRPLSVAVSKGVPDWRLYGLSTIVSLGTDWQQYTLSFTAAETASDARVQFMAGGFAGQVWLSDVHLTALPPRVMRRDFTNGIVLLNPTRSRQQVSVEPGFQHIQGPQAARHEYIVDDTAPAFQPGTRWNPVTLDSGMWKAAGPYFHNWGAWAHRCSSSCGTSTWNLDVREDGTYTIAAWWPAAPEATLWSRRVTYELLSGGTVIAATTMDQTMAGDQWHELFQGNLTVAAGAAVRIRNDGGGAAIADALWVRSAARLNDGSPVTSVSLEPMDAIVLARPAAYSGAQQSSTRPASGSR